MSEVYFGGILLQLQHSFVHLLLLPPCLATILWSYSHWRIGYQEEMGSEEGLASCLHGFSLSPRPSPSSIGSPKRLM